MKSILVSLALALTAAVAAASPVKQPKAGLCDPSDITGAYACVGGLSGNDLGNAANIAKVGQEFADLGGFLNPFQLIDNSNGTRGTQAALIFDTGGTTGELLLKDPTDLLNFNIFGISLKAGNFYSLYLFDGSQMLFNGIMENISSDFTSLDFTTAGTGLNWKNQPLGLSHASLWGVEPSNFGGCFGPPGTCEELNVPEPGSLALAGLGLFGIAAAVRRNRKQA